MPAGAIYDYQRVSVIDMQLNLYWDDNAKWKFTYYLYIIYAINFSSITSLIIFMFKY